MAYAQVHNIDPRQADKRTKAANEANQARAEADVAADAKQQATLREQAEMDAKADAVAQQGSARNNPASAPVPSSAPPAGISAEQEKPASASAVPISASQQQDEGIARLLAATDDAGAAHAAAAELPSPARVEAHGDDSAAGPPGESSAGGKASRKGTKPARKTKRGRKKKRKSRRQRSSSPSPSTPAPVTQASTELRPSMGPSAMMAAVVQAGFAGDKEAAAETAALEQAQRELEEQATQDELARKRRLRAKRNARRKKRKAEKKAERRRKLAADVGVEPEWEGYIRKQLLAKKRKYAQHKVRRSLQAVHHGDVAITAFAVLHRRSHDADPWGPPVY